MITISKNSIGILLRPSEKSPYFEMQALV